MQELFKYKYEYFLKLLIIIIIIFDSQYFRKSNIFKNKFDINFKYHNYQREMITEKMITYSSWQLGGEQPYFLNGIIRKCKPKKLLEIGVAAGGSSIVILNAIKDIENSFLVSLDINISFYRNNTFKTGYSVFKYFPELTKKWKLFTGEQSHKFLDKLKLKFDFLFLDTVHFSPGELINIIEVLPFLEENAIIVLHDMMFDLQFIPKYHPSNIFLMAALSGDKVILENKNKKIENIGAIHLYSNQKKYYLNYFLLLLSAWEYMPNEKHIQEIRDFIKKYYKEEIYINLFNIAVEENKKYIN